MADKLDDASCWSLCNDESLMKKTGELPRHVPGKFGLRQVEDDERGRCLELELHGDSGLSDYIGEYWCHHHGQTGVPSGRAAHARPLGERQFLVGQGGVRVPGRRGRHVWRTHGNEWHDWPGELSINFDGWHFIQFPIDTQSPIIYSSPGGRCQRLKGSGRNVTYPISLTKLYVVMNRRALDPTEMQPVPPAIRISSVGGY